MDCSEYDTFEAAFIALYRKLKIDLLKGMSWQVLETTIWIEKDGTPINFYDSRDRACRCNLLVDGELNEEMAKTFEKTIGEQ